MILRLSSGSVMPVRRSRNRLAEINHMQGNVAVAAEQLDDLFGLARAQQAGVDQDADQLVADRLVQQERRDRRIDAARQAADHPAGADLLAHPRIACSRNAAMVQSAAQPATRCAKFASSSWPRGVCTTSGWNCTP